MLYREELQNLSGLVNEVISSAEGRIVFDQSNQDDEKATKKITGLEETVMLTICEANLMKLYSWSPISEIVFTNL